MAAERVCTLVEPTRGFLTSDDALTMSHVVDMSLLSSEFQLFGLRCVQPFRQAPGCVFLSVELLFPKGPCQLHLCRSKAATGLKSA